MALEMKLLSIGTLLGNMEGGSFIGDFEGRVEGSSGDGCLSPQGPVGEPRESVD